MKIQKLIFLWLLLAAVPTSAQLTMALQVPPVGVVQKTQLWNMVLVNAGNTATAEVNITMLNVADHTPVLTAASRSVTLQKGANQLRYTDFSPVAWKYLSGAFSADMNPEGLIPVGNYTVCYAVGGWQGDTYVSLTEDCINLEIQPLSPPVLNTPADKDTLLSLYPQFTWLPPSPLNLFSNLSYDVSVTAVLQGQSALQAVQQNIPFYTAGNLATPISIYPVSAPSLDTARWYAWAVVAKNNNQVVAQSEVWMFYVPGMTKGTEDIAARSYLLLKKEQDAAGVSFIAAGGAGLSFYSYEKEHQAAITFTGPDGSVVRQAKVMVSYGNNFWWFDNKGDFKKNSVYKVSLQDSHRSQYITHFMIQ
ncbi:hypothetical protein SAMN05421788_106227 [Filimonas lacunae]|uniref:Uncharacterized protein n=1 Tax=Filimonas lacunae TaxID=477680 RepID=A0A173MEZ6_9BACT|nr:hypothetical protein [Filimonas lacunae]BAV06164.1 hypothetical protein FLA_2180 [Filimonas lacunae]SIT25026.1 hypothetical protein SAMN05421788_106227 [Filimonas lacunae]